MKTNCLKIIFFIILAVLSTDTNAAANDIYAFVLSKELTQTKSLVNGFVGSFPDAEISVFDMKGEEDSDEVGKFIKKTKPSVIICTGSNAAKAAAKSEKRIPIIFSMVINYKRYPELQQSNMTGISMEIPSEALFTQFRMLMPQVRSIGVPYHPAVSSEIVEDALIAAKKMGIDLIRINMTDPDKMKDGLSDNEKKYSGLWMLADTKLYTRENMTALNELMSFSAARKKPVLAFSEAFLNAGAFFSVSIDYKSMGSQIALVSKRIVLDKTPVSQMPPAMPIGTFTVINKNIAKTLMGDAIDDSIFEQVDKVYPPEKDNKG